jgi:trehalose 6-phosphate phosphatase
MPHYDEPSTVAREVAARGRPLLIGLDVDGVLAPIVGHAAEARLLEGSGPAVRAVARHPGVHVAVVSGRSIEDLTRFGFGGEVMVVGSHGMEVRGRPMAALDPIEVERLMTLRDMAHDAAALAGEGAWVEEKPASVVLHVRQADPDAGSAALEDLHARSSQVDGVAVKPGSAVLELFTRSADKGRAMTTLTDEIGAATTVFVGDDVTDEDAFAVLRPGDISVKVGSAATIAGRRLRDPHDVLRWLHELDGALAQKSDD